MFFFSNETFTIPQINGDDMTGNSSKSFEKFLTTTTYKKSAQTTRHSMRASNYLPVNGDFFTKINGNAVGWIKSIKFTHSIFHNGRSKNVWLTMESTQKNGILVWEFFFTNKEWEILTFLVFFFKKCYQSPPYLNTEQILAKKCIIFILNDFPFAKSENPMTFCSCKCQLFFVFCSKNVKV